MTGMVTIGQVLRGVLRSLKRSVRKVERARGAWLKAVPNDVAELTQVSGVKDGVLFVVTPSAPLLSELIFYRKPELLRRLAEVDPGLNVRDIRFRLDARR